MFCCIFPLASSETDSLTFSVWIGAKSAKQGMVHWCLLNLYFIIFWEQTQHVVHWRESNQLIAAFKMISWKQNKKLNIFKNEQQKIDRNQLLQCFSICKLIFYYNRWRIMQFVRGVNCCSLRLIVNVIKKGDVNKIIAI